MKSIPHDTAPVLSKPRRAVRGTVNWLNDQRALWLDYLIILTVALVVCTAIIKFYPQYYPDSAHYVARALWYSGMSQQEALDVVYQMHVASGFEPNTSIAGLFDWGLVAPRVVLPILAVPFVMVLGPSGLAVTTLLITLTLIVALYKFLSGRYGRVAAVFTVVLMQSSFLIMVFSLGMLTESLSALWGVAALAAAYRYQNDPRRTWIIAMVSVTLLAAFTRQATLILAGAFVVAWMLSRLTGRPARWGIPALAIAGTAVVTQLLQSWIFPFSQGDQYLRMTGADSLWGALVATPSFASRLIAEEFTSYATQDQALLVILSLAFVSMVVFWRRTESHLLLGALLATALYSITNGNSTDFRYAIPGLVFFVTSIAVLIEHVVERESAANRVLTTKSDALGATDA